MAIIPQDDSDFTVELTDDDLLEYLNSQMNMKYNNITHTRI